MAQSDLQSPAAVLTTHVLDLSTGGPGAGISVALFRIGTGERVLVAQAVTNAQGRCAAPLLTRDSAEAGTYLLEFDAGRYFAAGLLTVVPVEFNIVDIDGHHHVPLVLAPGGYSTYRGAPPHRAPSDHGSWVLPTEAEDVSGMATPALPGTVGAGLTVHVIDIAQGRGAALLRVDLLRLGADAPSSPIKTCITNGEGRTTEWLVETGGLQAGTYELIFHMGDYFSRAGFPVGRVPFFARARIRINVADTSAHWHIPLLVAPWGYTCYRGS